MRWLLPIVAVSALVVVVFLLRDGKDLLRGGNDVVRSGLSVAEAVSGDTAGYARASEPRPFTFPEDYGPIWRTRQIYTAHFAISAYEGIQAVRIDYLLRSTKLHSCPTILRS